MSVVARKGVVALLIAVIGGIFLGEAVWQSLVRFRASEAPPGWLREPGDRHAAIPELRGLVTTRVAAWELHANELIRPKDLAVAMAPARLEATVHLPIDGELAVLLAAPLERRSSRGVGLQLSRVGAPTAVVFQRNDGVQQPLQCDAELTLPTQGPVHVMVEPAERGIRAQIGDATTLCRVKLPDGGPALHPGLMMVQVEDLKLGQTNVPWPSPVPRPAWWAIGATLAAAVVAIELWLGGSTVIIALTTLPLLLAAIVAPTHISPPPGAGRPQWLPSDALAAIIPVGLALWAKATHLLGRSVREPPPPPRRDWPLAASVAATLPMALAFGTEPGDLAPVVATLGALIVCPIGGVGLAGLLKRIGSEEPHRAATLLGAAASIAATALAINDTQHRFAIADLTVAALGWGVLVWSRANSTRARRPALVAIGATLLVGMGGEAWVRSSQAGQAWAPIGVLPHPPAAAPPPMDGRQRVVLIGRIHRANEPMREANWPRRVSEQLGGHIDVVDLTDTAGDAHAVRQHVESNLDQLAPAVLVTLLGHDDVLAPERFKNPSGQSVLLLATGLHQGLKAWSAITTPFDQGLVEARTHLEALVDLVDAQGGHVVLGAEGLAPDPGPLRAFHRMMDDVAERHPSASYLDLAGSLHAWRSDRLFVDDCLLSEEGGQLVANEVVAHLEQLERLKDDARP
jgi:hypothetical protein